MTEKFGTMPSNTVILLQHKKYEETKGVRQSTLPFLLEDLKDKRVLTIDIETKPKKGYEWYSLAGLDPHTSNIVSIQIGDDELQWVID